MLKKMVVTAHFDEYDDVTVCKDLFEMLRVTMAYRAQGAKSADVEVVRDDRQHHVTGKADK